MAWWTNVEDKVDAEGGRGCRGLKSETMSQQKDAESPRDKFPFCPFGIFAPVPVPVVAEEDRDGLCRTIDQEHSNSWQSQAEGVDTRSGSREYCLSLSQTPSATCPHYRLFAPQHVRPARRRGGALPGKGRAWPRESLLVDMRLMISFTPDRDSLLLHDCSHHRASARFAMGDALANPLCRPQMVRRLA